MDHPIDQFQTVYSSVTYVHADLSKLFLSQRRFEIVDSFIRKQESGKLARKFFGSRGLEHSCIGSLKGGRAKKWHSRNVDVLADGKAKRGTDVSMYR